MQDIAIPEVIHNCFAEVGFGTSDYSHKQNIISNNSVGNKLPWYWLFCEIDTMSAPPADVEYFWLCYEHRSTGKKHA